MVNSKKPEYQPVKLPPIAEADRNELQSRLYEKFGIERKAHDRNLQEFVNMKLNNKLLRNAGGEIMLAKPSGIPCTRATQLISIAEQVQAVAKLP